jgi:fructose-1,6-bisphosphatase/inositol monophosphatase family enzyme
MLAEHEISTKTGPTDLVTVADIEAEEELTRIFEDLIPGSHVIGEEAVSNETTDMGLLKTETGYIWVVDPVDGTGNFANGDSKFGTIVTLVKNGESIQGWIYDSQYNRMAITEKGGGVQINGVSKTYPAMTDSLQESRGFISRKFLPSKMRRELKDVLDTEFGKVDTYLCCAHEYLDILDGKSFFSLYSRIRPWDHLTGTMMMSEAGGYVRKWDGSEYGPGDERGGVICAQDRDTWDNIYDLLLKRYLEEAA